ncbi:DUF3784 domain-containing protein [Lysinibacillus sp. LZ02]|uniref:DUF3784 domain-containing protein n=1 Tax=Lysinibacillus sp. LZ02 TaxID=3420668 RepID=UPI003D3670AA
MDAAIIYIIILILFLIFAIVLSKGKGAFLIAGYNTLPKSEKAKYDEVALAKFMGKVMYGYCFSIMLWGLSELINQQWLFIVGLVLFIALTIFTIVYGNTGNRFKK